MNPRVPTFALAALIAFSTYAAEPVTLRSIDPLTIPAPAVAVDWDRLAARARDPRPPDARIVPSLWERRVALPREERLRVIVTLDEGLLDLVGGAAAWSPEARATYRAALEHAFVRRAVELGFVPSRGLSQFAIVLGEIPAGRLIELAALPAVLGIEEQRVYRAHRIEGRGLIQSNPVRLELGGTGAGVGVAVMDTGIDATHPELQVLIGADTTGTSSGGGFLDDNGHGTRLAGIIAGTQRGVATLATLWSFKVLRADGFGADSWILGALDALYEERDDFGGLHVINMSFGSGGPFNSACDDTSPAYAFQFSRLAEAGIALVVSAGNDGFPNGVSFPACMSQVISVGPIYDAALGPQGYDHCADDPTTADVIPCYANTGIPLALLAPAECASTTALNSGTDPCFGGSSAAAAYVSGAAAQILSLRPATTPTELKQALAATGRPVTDPRNGITRPRIDVLAAYLGLAGGGEGDCASGPTTLCLDDEPGDRRFKVEVTYQTAQGGGSSGVGKAVPLAGLGLARGGMFWFFNPANPEMLVKVLDACVPPFERHWVFYSAGTNVGFSVTVTDTETGQAKVYTNPDGQAALPEQDTDAFPCP